MYVGIWLMKANVPSPWGIDPRALSAYWSGLFCLVGHMFPCMFQFKGARASSPGHHRHHHRLAGGLGGLGGFLILTVLTRYVSLGSSSTGVTLPIVTLPGSPQPDPVPLPGGLGRSAGNPRTWGGGGGGGESPPNKKEKGGGGAGNGRWGGRAGGALAFFTQIGLLHPLHPSWQAG